MMKSKEQVACLMLALLAVTGVLVGCYGDVARVTFVADEQRTIDLAEKRGFSYCRIFSTEVCQSPDSILVFHLPRHLNMAAETGDINTELVIENEGLGKADFLSFSWIVVDQENRVYTWSGESDYPNPSSPRSPALTIAPGQSERIPLVGRLEGNYPSLERVTFVYKLVGAEDERRITWTFKPLNIQAI